MNLVTGIEIIPYEFNRVCSVHVVIDIFNDFSKRFSTQSNKKTAKKVFNGFPNIEVKGAD